MHKNHCIKIIAAVMAGLCIFGSLPVQNLFAEDVYVSEQEAETTETVEPADTAEEQTEAAEETKTTEETESTKETEATEETAVNETAIGPEQEAETAAPEEKEKTIKSEVVLETELYAEAATLCMLKTANAANGVKLSWTRPEGAEGYYLYRGTNKYRMSRIAAITDGTKTSYLDTSAEAGVKVYYGIKPVRGSQPGEIEYAVHTLMAVPQVNCKNQKDGIQISWGEIAGAEQYSVYRKTGSGRWVFLGNSETCSFTDTKAKDGTVYYYTARALNDGKPGAYRSGTAILRLSAPKLEIINGTDHVKLSWKQSAGATGYNIYKGTNPLRMTRIATLTSGNVTGYTDQKPEAGVTYYYGIKSTYGSTFSELGYTKHAFLTVPAVTVKNLEEAVSVCWDHTAGAEKYRIYRKTEGGSWEFRETVSAGGEPVYTDPSAEEGITYFYAVRAQKGSALSTYTAKEIRRLSVPQVEAVNAASGVEVSWNQVSGAAGYHIYRKTTGAWKKVSSISGGTINAWTDTEVSSGQKYDYTVRAYYKERLSAYEPCGQILYLSQPTVTAACSGSGIQVGWSKVDGAAEYAVFRKTEAEETWTLYKQYDAPVRGFIDKHVEQGAVYQYEVSACAEAFGSSMQPISICYIKPVQITSVEVKKYNAAVITCNDTGASGYEIWRNTEKDGSYTCVYDGPDPGFSDEGKLDENTVYYYKARAYVENADGSRQYGKYSTPVSCRTAHKPQLSMRMNKTNYGTYSLGLEVSNQGSEILYIGGDAASTHCVFYPTGAGYYIYGRLLSSSFEEVDQVAIAAGKKESFSYWINTAYQVTDASVIAFIIHYDNCEYYVYLPVTGSGYFQ